MNKVHQAFILKAETLHFIHAICGEAEFQTTGNAVKADVYPRA